MTAYRKGDLNFICSTNHKVVSRCAELYNLRRDLGEKDNIADKHPELVAEILKAIATHKANLPRKPPLFDQRFVDMMQKMQTREE